MAVADNFLTLGQNFFSPDIIQKVSEQIGLSQDKTKSALKSIVPAFLSGVVDKGSTPEGAASIVNMANTHNFQTSVQPDASKMGEGNEVVNDIFGSNLNSVVSKVNTSTGVDSSSIKKIMSMVAPGIMGFIASKIKSENLGSTGLMNFLSSQKSALASFGTLSSGLTGMKHFAEGKVSTLQQATSQKQEGKKFPVLYFILAALVVLGFFYWLVSMNKSTDVPLSPTAESNLEKNMIPTTNDLSAFLAAGIKTQLPKHFQFETLNFANASATLNAEASAELDKIVSALNTHPAVRARIEGYTDNVGAADTNKKLSEMRAVAVKNELVSRGIASDRLIAIGMGDAYPVADNATAEGRAKNRRIDFVVTKIK